MAIAVHNTRCGQLPLVISKHLIRLNLLMYAALRYLTVKYMHKIPLAVRTANMKATVICFILNMSRPKGDASALTSITTLPACDDCIHS